MTYRRPTTTTITALFQLDFPGRDYDILFLPFHIQWYFHWLLTCVYCDKTWIGQFWNVTKLSRNSIVYGSFHVNSDIVNCGTDGAAVDFLFVVKYVATEPNQLSFFSEVSSFNRKKFVSIDSVEM